MAVENLITEHIDIWTSAVKTKSTSGRGSSNKLELYGVKKLRELILELAVRGKLVPQDPNDEPASVLLERIASEKAQLIKDKKIKKPKKLLALNDEDIPFGLPEGWEWSQVNELAKVVTDGVHHTPKYLDNGVPFISVKDIDGKSISFDDCKYISQEQHEEINQRCNPEKGDILLCRIGTLGRATIVDTEKAFSLFVSVGLLKFFNEQLLPEYLHTVFHSPLLLRQYDEIKAGGSHTNKLNLGDIPRLKIPVAPLQEQHRIVAKVDELMALCDQLEQQTEASIEAHQVLVTTLLDTLTNSADANELMQNWARISEHFDTLFTTEESIDQLKQTILQLAVMGKLVPQYSNDKVQTTDLDPVVKKHRKLLSLATNTGKIDLTSFESISKKVSFPDNWAVRPLAEVVLAVVDCPHSTPKWTDSGEICVRTTQMAPFKLDLSSSRYVSSDTYIKRIERLEPTEDDVLYSREGGILGIACRVPSGTKLCLGQRMIVIRPSTFITSKFLELVLNSPLINEIARYNTTGGAAPRVNVAVIKGYPIPLPALDEQNRIIDKAEELTEICNRLKVRLKESHTILQDLTNAMVEQAV
ncbi:TPA: restriction endonuclease subunit S [Vibrio diabolicus]